MNKLHTLGKNKQIKWTQRFLSWGFREDTSPSLSQKGTTFTTIAMFLMCTFFLGMEVHGRGGTNDHSFRNLIDAQKRLEDAWQSKMRGHGLKSVTSNQKARN